MAKREQELGMSFGVGLAVGLASGFAGLLLYKKHKALTTKDVLHNARKHFNRNGRIEASWIRQEKEVITQMDKEVPVYIGGIVRDEEGLLITYEFTADAKTGTLIKIEQVEELED